MSWSYADTLTVGRQSWLRAWPAWLKLLILLALGSTLVLVQRVDVLLLAALAATIIWRSVVGPLDWRAWRKALWLVLTLLAIVAYTMMVDSVSAGVAVFCRLWALLMVAQAVTASTPVIEMMEVVRQVLKPFGRLGWVDPDKVALAFGLALRMVPVLLEQWQEIREAQAARGITSAPYALLIPMLARTLQRVDALSEAIDARSS